MAQRMLDVAVERIEAEGMTVGLDGIRLERVIEQAGVSRATAYRRWPNRDAFLAAVLVEVVRRTSLIPETADDIARLTTVVASHRGVLHTAQGRRDLVVEALRVSIDLDVRRILDSPRWRTFLSLSATYPGLPEGEVREAVGHALADTDRAFARRRAEVYAGLAAILGYRLTDGSDDFETLGSAAGTTMTGIVLRALPRPEWLDERRSARLFGASVAADWSEPERLLVGLLLASMEPDPTVSWDAAAVAARLGEFHRLAASLRP